MIATETLTLIKITKTCMFQLLGVYYVQIWCVY